MTQQNTDVHPRRTVGELVAIFLKVWLVVALAATFVIGRSAYCQRNSVIANQSLTIRRTVVRVEAITKREHKLVLMAVLGGVAAGLCVCGGIACMARSSARK